MNVKSYQTPIFPLGKIFMNICGYQNKISALICIPIDDDWWFSCTICIRQYFCLFPTHSYPLVFFFFIFKSLLKMLLKNIFLLPPPWHSLMSNPIIYFMKLCPAASESVKYPIYFYPTYFHVCMGLVLSSSMNFNLSLSGFI